MKQSDRDGEEVLSSVSIEIAEAAMNSYSFFPSGLSEFSMFLKKEPCMHGNSLKIFPPDSTTTEDPKNCNIRTLTNDAILSTVEYGNPIQYSSHPVSAREGGFYHIEVRRPSEFA